jgi:hypothetical protein
MVRVKGNGSLWAKEIAIVTVVTCSTGEAPRSREKGFFRRESYVDL